MVIEGGWQIVQMRTEASEWSSGLNHVSLRFSRGTRPVDLGTGADSRTLSAAIDYLRIRAIQP